MTMPDKKMNNRHTTSALLSQTHMVRAMNDILSSFEYTIEALEAKGARENLTDRHAECVAAFSNLAGQVQIELTESYLRQKKRTEA